MKPLSANKTATALVCLSAVAASTFGVVNRLTPASEEGARSSSESRPPIHVQAGRDPHTDVTTSTLDERRVATLNRLRNEINSTYGYKDGVPRVNFGPCGRFAKEFRERWNARFNDKVEVAFLMMLNSTDTKGDPICVHILIKLPDGSYFDGGNGVVSDRALLKQFPFTRIEEMKKFNPLLLEKNAGGFDRKYPLCPGYSDDTTAKIIDQHLALLPKDVKN